MKKAFYFFLCAAAISSSSKAQISLTGDINSGISSSNPNLFTPFNGKLYMVATTTATGSELFSYDGSSAPNLANELVSGSTTGVQNVSVSMAVLDGQLYFSGNSDGLGYELTKVGTSGVPVRAGNDLYAGPLSSSPSCIIAMQGKIYFTANTATAGAELFVYNPATNTSTLVVDLASGTNSSYPDNFCVYKDKLYFSANVLATGRELYSYDPATNATTLVSDINVGSPSSVPAHMMVADGKLYFIALSATNGSELYSYDGATITRCTDVQAGATNGISFAKMAWYKGKIYFSGYDAGAKGQLYAYDPATSSSALVYAIDAVAGGFPSSLTVYGGKLYFSAKDPVNGNELWESDGITTKIVQDLNPGTANSFPNNLAVWNGKLYFSATEPTYGYEFYSLSTPEGLGMDNVSFKGNIILAPNPTIADTRLLLNLDVAQKLKISVSDITGKQLYQVPATLYQSGHHEVTFPMSGYAAGNYFFTIANEQGQMLMNGKISKL